MANKGNATSSRVNNTAGQARVVKCYNCQGERHMARQCTQHKRPRNSAWFKEKMLLVEAQESGQVLDEEQLAFLADPRFPDVQAIKTTIPQNASFQTDDLNAYDSDCDDVSSAKAVLMANLLKFSEDLGSLNLKKISRIFVGYAPVKKAFRIYNKRTRLIMETIHVDFDKLTAMAFEQFSSGPMPQLMTPGTLSLRLMPNPPSPTPVASPVTVVAAQEPVDLTDTPSSNTIDQDAPSLSTYQTPHEIQSQAIPGVEENSHDIEVAHMDNDPYFGVPIPEPSFKETSSRDVIPANNYKEALKEASWIEAMQEDLSEFERLKVWELVPRPDRVMIITLKWIFKAKTYLKVNYKLFKRIFDTKRNLNCEYVGIRRILCIALTNFCDADHDELPRYQKDVKLDSLQLLGEY
ncbi:retrovirus-related pol polyprotein from transposon TNT 1-94 [Tanacetum coccineum]